MNRTKIAILVALVLALVLVFGATGCCPLLDGAPAEAEEAGPMILIDSPRQGDEVTVGEPVQVFATGQDPNRIARMELWADGGLIQSQASALPDGTNPFPLMAIWVPETLGNHTIVVRGYNTNDVEGQASISVNAVEAPLPQLPPGCEGVDLFDHEVQMGETLEGIAAGYELTAEEILACNPGLDPAAPLTPGDVLQIPAVVTPEEEGPPADFEPPPVETPPDVPPEEELPGEELPPPEEEPPPGEEAPPEVEEVPEGPEVEELPPPEEPPVTLTFEALELEVDQFYENVYCMVRLADTDMEQVPETGSFAHVGGNYWDIQAELAGMNSVPVPVSGGIFRVEVECYGWVGINGWTLGHFVREHGDGEWTGDPIDVTATADDGRWFRVMYRICPDYPCEPRPVPPAPENLIQTTGCPCDPPLGCPPCPILDALAWDWAGDEATIDGFRLYRNDTMLLEDPNPSARAMVLPAAYFDPPCGEEWNYHLTAYQGFPGVGVESDPSNTVTLTGPACPLTVVATFETLYTGCIKMDPCGDPTCAACYVPNFHMWVWANGESLEREPKWGPPFMESYSALPMDDLLHLGDASVTVELDPTDNLTLGLAAVDWDPGPTYSLLLLGARTLTPAEVVTDDYFFLTHAPVGPWPWDAWAYVKVHLEVTP
jgi:LysM repeat protein